MSQIIRSRKLANQLSKKYFRYRIRKITNCHYLNKQNVNRARFQKDNDESDRRQSNETCEDGNNNAFHNIDNDNEEDESDSNNSDTSNVCGIIIENTNNFFYINNCEVENNEMEDFTTSHLAKWCRTLNVPMIHINVLLKDIRKHKCFKTVFPSDIRTISGTPTFTPIKSVPPGEYYHQGLISELVRILSKCNIEKVNLTLNIDGLPLSKSSGQQLWPILVSVAGVQGEIMVGAYCGYKKSDDINLFLEDFVSEVIYLINNGLEINNRLLSVRL